MKWSKRSNTTKLQRKLKDTLIRLFLIVSIVFSILVVSNCDFLTNFIDDLDNGNGGGVGPGNNNLGSTAITALFKSAAEGAGGKIGGTAAGWALGALGLSNDSPDYSSQLDKIDESLQVIISQLNEVQTQLTDINSQLKILNCSIQQESLTDLTGRIDFLTSLYRSYIAQAANGGRVSNNTLSNWVEQVLAEGQYTGQTPMGQILTTMANKLIQPSSGAITVCVDAIPAPGNNTFSDIAYYNKVSQFTYYYYYYQAEGLFLLSEALHYKAWQTAASEDDDNYPADSVGEVCSNADASLFCTKAGTFTNNVYNALTDQFTTAGAPYTDDHFVIQYSETTPILWVKSLEEFTNALGSDCNSPLNSQTNRCGKTLGLYSSGNSEIENKIYRTYTNWQFANSSQLNELLSGWNSGTAGNYLKNQLDFKNMQKKIIISTSTTSISLTNSGAFQEAVIFFDTDVDKSKLDNKLFDNKNAFDLITPYVKSLSETSPCIPQAKIAYYTYKGSTPSFNSGWYTISDGKSAWCWTKELKGGVVWQTQPAWIASSSGSNSIQFRWPLTQVKNLKCTLNRSQKNTGGAWTTCGDDFTNWFNEIVPRPATCDLNVGVICKLDFESISKAKKMLAVKKSAQL